MHRKRLLWQIYPAYLAIALAALLAVYLHAHFTISRFQKEQTLENLKNRAVLIVDEIERTHDLANPSEIDAICKSLGRRTSARVTVVLPSGVVIGDSERDPSTMVNHLDRPEVRDALQGRVSHSTRYSDTLRQNLMYLGYPVTEDNRVTAVVRTSVPLASITETLRGLHWSIGALIFTVCVLMTLFSYFLSRSISRPLEEMRHAAERVACGDYDLRLVTEGTEEMGSLAASMNSMAAQLSERIRLVVQHRNELEAVFSSMIEGIIVLDHEGRIVRLNSASAGFLGVSAGNATGRTLLETVRNLQLHLFAARVLESERGVEDDIVLEDDKGKRFIQAHGAPLRDEKGANIGALMVLNDVTRIRRMEDIRKDFVANVSHELRTPVTSIKGFAETLMDGAARNPADLERFLGIIAKQADRLNSIINDILSLSRIEHDAERNAVELAPGRLVDVLNDAIEVCSDRAGKKTMNLNIECDQALEAMMNAPLLEQAVVNLIDNAVKYGGDGTPVGIAGKAEKEWVVIKVVDHGPGIEKIHLDRIFERFYRVDKGRSRQMGGTGLGLAIVKHVALVHKGDVGVESVPGKGSSFSIYLQPAPKPN